MLENNENTTVLQSKIENTDELELAFKEIVDKGIKIFKDTKTMAEIVFLMMKDSNEDKLIAIGLPIPNMNNQLNCIISSLIKSVIDDIKSGSIPGLEDKKLIGVVHAADAHLSMYEKNDPNKPLMGTDGKITNFTPPSKDANAKDVLFFSCESLFKRHIVSYEYITSAEGEVAVSSTPFIDNISPYNEIEARNSKFGFLFTEGTTLN